MIAMLDDGELARCWTDLFRTDGCTKGIEDLCDKSSKKSVMEIPYSEIVTYNKEFSDYLLLKPEHTIMMGEALLRELIGLSKDPHISIFGLPDTCIEDFDDTNRHADGRFISIKGTVIKASIPIRDRNRPQVKHVVDYQCMEIITGFDVSSQSVNVRLRNHVVKNDIFGRTLKFNGFWKNDSTSGQNNDFCIHFEVNSIELLENDFGISFTDGDIEEITKASKDPLFFDNLIKSIAPTIAGMDDIKEVLALQLFGGVEHISDDNCYNPGAINVLLLAEPYAGVPTLVKAMSRLSPRGYLLSREDWRCVTPLIGRVVDDHFGKDMTSIDVGAVTIANKGLVCCEGIDRLERTEMLTNDVAYHGYDHITGKISCNLPADTSVLATTLPIWGRVEKGVDPLGQMGIPNWALSKLGLVMVVRDVPEEIRDRYIAEQIINKHLRANILGMKDEDVKKVILDRTSDSSTVYSEDFIKKYVAYAKLNCNPKVQESNLKIIEEGFLSFRERHTIVSTLWLRLLINLAEASARSRLSDIVDDSDASKAVRIMGDALTNLESIKNT